MDWKKQGSAVTAPVTLYDGMTSATVVIVGPRSNAKGAVLVVPGDEEGKTDKLPFAQAIEQLSPKDAIEVIVMQERLHGESRLKPPAELQ